jgi:hypothetical protein
MTNNTTHAGQSAFLDIIVPEDFGVVSGIDNLDLTIAQAEKAGNNS